MVGVGRDLCGSSSPIPLPKQGHLQQAAQDLVQAGLEYLQRRGLHNLPGQPVPVLRHPQREEVLPHVQMEVPRSKKSGKEGKRLAWLRQDLLVKLKSKKKLHRQRKHSMTLWQISTYLLAPLVRKGKYLGQKHTELAMYFRNRSVMNEWFGPLKASLSKVLARSDLKMWFNKVRCQGSLYTWLNEWNTKSR